MSKKEGKFKRKCALETCRKEFTTDDARKVYHSRMCGRKKRSKRWYNAAAAALRSLRSGSKLKSVISVHGGNRAVVGGSKARKVKATRKAHKARPKARKMSKPHVKAKVKRVRKPKPAPAPVSVTTYPE